MTDRKLLSGRCAVQGQSRNFHPGVREKIVGCAVVHSAADRSAVVGSDCQPGPHRSPQKKEAERLPEQPDSNAVGRRGWVSGSEAGLEFYGVGNHRVSKDRT